MGREQEGRASRAGNVRRSQFDRSRSGRSCRCGCLNSRKAREVEVWRGGLGSAHPLPALSSAGASLASPCPVSTPHLSNPARRFPAPGSRRKRHGVAHGRLAVRNLSRTNPDFKYTTCSENRSLTPSVIGGRPSHPIPGGADQFPGESVSRCGAAPFHGALLSLTDTQHPECAMPPSFLRHC